MSQNTFYEPHPSTTGRAERNGSVIFGSARGGAGNYHAYPRSAISDASAPLKHTPKTSTTAAATRSGYVTSGRGGAGNLARASHTRAFDFDEELDRLHRSAQKHQERDEVVLVGRGGAGNRVHASKSRQNSGSSVASSNSSASTGIADAIRRSLGRR